ncbi:MAG: hypothetical protein C0467_04515 [Planctomycetaceae bacterium]|nr:hypothetical protein [Planctomycetaceae bacterium]
MSAAKPRPPLFRALGKNDPPTEVVVGGITYFRTEIYKHDSWAATALYSSEQGQIVCKFNRTQPILGLSTAWLGRRLASREHRALTRLADLDTIPKPMGAVYANGRLQRNAVSRRYIPGHPLMLNERVGPHFYPALRATLAEMQRRGIAYVDLHKRENVIVGDDGRPYLVDFQICFDVTHPRVRWLPGIRTVFDALCTGDRYHLQKHAHRLDGSAEDAPRPVIPAWLQAHRLIAVPFRQLRRRMLVSKGIRSGRGAVSTEVFAEDAVRRESASRAA